MSPAFHQKKKNYVTSCYMLYSSNFSRTLLFFNNNKHTGRDMIDIKKLKKIIVVFEAKVDENSFHLISQRKVVSLPL